MADADDGEVTTDTVEDVRASDESLSDVRLPPRFEVKRILGRGGMGVVVEAIDQTLGREVAVKLLAQKKREDASQRLRFLREAKAAATLRHPNIVTVHDVDPDRDFIVMELVHGESLRERLKRDKPLPPDEVRRIALPLLDALGAAHAAQIVHRDVKPANILIDRSGVVRLVDFGIASFGDRDLTSSGQLLGTPAYMAPEQLRGRAADARADIYAVGATLFEAATGRRLHELDGSIGDEVVKVSGDPVLAAAIERATAYRPEERFPDARGFASALEAPAVAPEREVERVVAAAVAADVAIRRRRRRDAVVAGVIAAVAATALALLMWRGGSGGKGAAAPRTPRTVAVLPFVDHTREPRLDFAASGLSHILAIELRAIRELRVLGYYELLDRLPEADAPAADWLAAARDLGADVIVRGELFPDRDGVRVVFGIESVEGKALGRVETRVTVDAVPSGTRSAAGDVARLAFGGATPGRVGAQRNFEADRNLQLGIAALERQDFAAADAHLRTAELEAPDLAEVQYHRAVLDWWTSRDARVSIARALAGELDEAQRGFMEGLRFLYNQTAPKGSIAWFRVLAGRFPEHRDIQYGLFEALFHGGEPAQAMEVYRRLVERHPRFRLGLKHALTFHIGHADEAGIAAALERLDPTSPETPLWQARARVAVRDYDGAISILRRADDGGVATLDVRRELAQVYVLAGQLELASDLSAGWSGTDLPHTATDLLGLAKARGRRGDEAELARKATSVADVASGDDQRVHGWATLAAIELPDGDDDRLRAIAPHVDANQLDLATTVTLLAAALDEPTPLDAMRVRALPEVVALTDADAAEARGDWAAARDAWTRAIAVAGEGTHLILEWLGVARAARALTDHEGVRKACDEVIRPRRFTWQWGGAVGPCLRWSAEAAEVLGLADDARAQWQRLASLRADAPGDDPLLAAAQAGLRRTAAVRAGR